MRQKIVIGNPNMGNKWQGDDIMGNKWQGDDIALEYVPQSEKRIKPIARNMVAKNIVKVTRSYVSVLFCSVVLLLFISHIIFYQ